MNTHSDNRIVVGMSGGIDSTCCVSLLKEQGYTVIGVTVVNWSEGEDTPQYAVEAARLAEKAGIDRLPADALEALQKE